MFSLDSVDDVTTTSGSVNTNSSYSPQSTTKLLHTSPLHKGKLDTVKTNSTTLFSSTGSNNNAHILLDYADTMRSSMDTLSGGLTMLHSTVETLYEIVQVDGTNSCQYIFTNAFCCYANRVNNAGDDDGEGLSVCDNINLLLSNIYNTINISPTSSSRRITNNRSRSGYTAVNSSNNSTSL